MAISDRTRKILWGRSGNRCAHCRRTLVEEGTELSGESVVGDECHIIGERPTAARGALGVGRDDLDEYDNLILCCKVHHKLVDDQPETYPVEKLREMKAAHERWVQAQLEQKPGAKPKFTMLVRIPNGTVLSNVIANAHAFSFQHDDLDNEDDVKLVAGFLQELQDYGDIWGDLDSGAHVEARFALGGRIKEIEAAGLAVFGGRETRKMKTTNNEVFDWEVGIVSVLRATNPDIETMEDLAPPSADGTKAGAP